MTRPSLMMCERSTDCPTVEKWISSLADSRAVPSPLLAENLVRPTTEIAGRIPFALLARSSQGTLSWKTCRISLEAVTSKLFSQALTPSGMMQDGCVYPLPQLALRTEEQGSGSWPTPVFSDWKGPNLSGSNTSSGHSLATKVMWPTPHANCHTGAGTQGRAGGLNIQTAVKMWPTPTVSDATRGGFADDAKRNKQGRGKQLRDQAGGTLNPCWVAWLMNWPLGAESLEPLPLANMRDWYKQSKLKTWYNIEPLDIPRVASSIQDRSSKLKTLGNGQVPMCVVRAFRFLIGVKTT